MTAQRGDRRRPDPGQLFCMIVTAKYEKPPATLGALIRFAFLSDCISQRAGRATRMSMLKMVTMVSKRLPMHNSFGLSTPQISTDASRPHHPRRPSAAPTAFSVLHRSICLPADHFDHGHSARFVHP
jgi:hypothetical protein